jgi:hypothetical protein
MAEAIPSPSPSDKSGEETNAPRPPVPPPLRSPVPPALDLTVANSPQLPPIELHLHQFLKEYGNPFLLEPEAARRPVALPPVLPPPVPSVEAPPPTAPAVEPMELRSQLVEEKPFDEVPTTLKYQGLPRGLRYELLEIEEWATANRRDALWDAIAFWGLKIPAVLAAASAGVWAYFNLTLVSVIAGAVASLCVIIDGIHPRGMLRNTHLRAYHDLRMLSSQMISKWRSRRPESNVETVAARIIREASDERRRIAAYIRDAETALTDKPNV